MIYSFSQLVSSVENNMGDNGVIRPCLLDHGACLAPTRRNDLSAQAQRLCRLK